MVLHKKFLMLYLANIKIEYYCGHRNQWYLFSTTKHTLDLFNNVNYQFRIKPDDGCVVADSNVKPLNNIDCEVDLL